MPPAPPQGELQRVLPALPGHALGRRHLLPRRSAPRTGAPAPQPRVPRPPAHLAPPALPQVPQPCAAWSTFSRASATFRATRARRSKGEDPGGDRGRAPEAEEAGTGRGGSGGLWAGSGGLGRWAGRGRWRPDPRRAPTPAEPRPQVDPVVRERARALAARGARGARPARPLSPPRAARRAPGTAREAAAQGLRWRTPGQRNRRRAGASGRTGEGCSPHLSLQLKCRWLDHGRILWVGGVRAPRAVEPSPEPRRSVGFPEGGVLRKDRALSGPGAALFAGFTPRLLFPAFNAFLACPLL